MSITIPSETGWFYNIIQAQTFVLGYGITSRSNPVDRLLEYSNAVAAPQEFCNLYFGDVRQIKDLERYVKSQWKKYRLELFSDRKLEWLDPVYKINVSDLEYLVAERIINYPYDNVYKVKSRFLPFTVHSAELLSGIRSNPYYFLEEVKIDRKLKTLYNKNL